MKRYNGDETTLSDGRSVILNRDGTWKFKGSGEKLLEIPGWGDALLYISLLLSGAFFLFLSNYLENLYGKQFWSALLTELGTALVVAGILAATVQYVEKKRDQRRFRAERETIKKDVFEHVFGYRLPSGTVEELTNQILWAKFIRKNFRCCYKLERVDDHGEKFMKVSATFTYDIENRTPETQTFDFQTAIENAPVERLNDHVKFTSVRVLGCEGTPLELDTPEKIAAKVRTDIRHNHQVIQEDISISGYGYASAVVKFDSVKAFEGGVSFLLHRLLTVGFYVKVDAPPEVEVSADGYFLTKLKKGPEYDKRSNTYNWVLDQPILPFQGVYVTWKTKGMVPASSSPQETTQI
jgi:hypothetical protein